MMDLNGVEVAVLAAWAAGVVAALYAVRDDASPLRRIGAPLLAALLPVLGTLVGLALALRRLARTRRVTGADVDVATDDGARRARP